MDFLMGHDGVDWAAGLCMVIMLWRLGQHKRDGFLWSAGAALAWIVFNARLSPVSTPGIAINAVVLILSVRSYVLWTRPGGAGASEEPASPPG